MKLPLLSVLAAALVAVSAPLALAATAKNGVRPVGPKDGASVPTVVASGGTPTFRARVRGPGTVYFTVCKSKRRHSSGQLCRGTSDDLDRGKKGKRTKRGRLYSFTPEDYTFPSYYLNTPGTYYWQVFRIACADKPGPLDCAAEGPIRKFVVG